MNGEIDGIEEGATFASRRELHDAGIHRGLQQGIVAERESPLSCPVGMSMTRITGM